MIQMTETARKWLKLFLLFQPRLKLCQNGCFSQKTAETTFVVSAAAESTRRLTNEAVAHYEHDAMSL